MREIRIACFSEQGERLGEQLNLGIVTRFPGKISLKEWTEAGFLEADALIYIGACAIAVRSIAPFIKSKVSDPAVIAMDETGMFIIPILSGHIGGANELSRLIADKTNGCPVITTATDRRHTFAADSWAVENGFGIVNPEAVKGISSAVLQGQEIVLSVRDRSEGQELSHTPGRESSSADTETVRQEQNHTSDYESSPTHTKTLKQGTEQTSISEGYQGHTKTSREEQERPSGHGNSTTHRSSSARKSISKNIDLRLVPRNIVVGAGCRKGTDPAYMNSCFLDFCKRNAIKPAAVTGIASIDLKSREPALTRLAASWKIPYLTYSAEELMAVSGDFHSSEFVMKTTGADNVCERAAVRACADLSGNHAHGRHCKAAESEIPTSSNESEQTVESKAAESSLFGSADLDEFSAANSDLSGVVDLVDSKAADSEKSKAADSEKSKAAESSEVRPIDSTGFCKSTNIEMNNTSIKSDINEGELICPKETYEGITLAAARIKTVGSWKWILEKEQCI